MIGQCVYGGNFVGAEFAAVQGDRPVIIVFVYSYLLIIDLRRHSAVCKQECGEKRSECFSDDFHGI
jgi:hypothetical protein